MISFPQFLAKHLARLPFKQKLSKTVTLHEACKAAFTGVDLTGARDVLRQIPGIELREMPRHGEKTVCCGGGAMNFFPESFARFRDDRLREAAHTQAEVLADVCHFCHEVFIAQEVHYPYAITNYVTLVAEALDIARKDTFKTYKQWGDPERILADAAPHIAGSPYSADTIRTVVETVFSPEGNRSE
jgi:Fe-S oxidoreductase